MAITNCPNGHYYDDSLFPECPYCRKSGQQPGRFDNTEFAGAMFGGTPSNNSVPNQKTRIVSAEAANPGTNAPVPFGGSGPKTQMYYDVKEYSSDPAGGWLVCINGPDKGKDFCVITEKTLIGRSGNKSYKVELSDEKISRNSAVAVIAYLQDSSSFMISPVPGGNLLIGLNDKVIYGPVALNDNDRIRIGDTVLVFMSFCNQNFDWDHYQVKYPPR